MSQARKGSIIKGALWMFFLGILLFWLPLVGPLIAGVVGGKKSGGVLAAMVALFLPGMVIGACLFLFATMLSGIPIIGFLAGMGGLAYSLFHVGTMLVGAIVGGLMA